MTRETQLELNMRAEIERDDCTAEDLAHWLWGIGRPRRFDHGSMGHELGSEPSLARLDREWRRVNRWAVQGMGTTYFGATAEQAIDRARARWPGTSPHPSGQWPWQREPLEVRMRRETRIAIDLGKLPRVELHTTTRAMPPVETPDPWGVR